MDVQTDALKRAAWEQLCDRAEAPLQQRWAYGETVERLGGTVCRLVAYDGKRPIALAQVLIRRFFVTIGLLSRGPIWIGDVSSAQQDAAYKALRQTLRWKGVRCAVLTPNSSGRLPLGHQIATAPTTATLALHQNMRQTLHGKWRNRLVKAESSTLRIKSLTARSPEHDWLFDNERKQRSDRGYKSLPPAFAEAWLRAPRTKALTLLASRQEPVAGMLFLRHGNTATYHLGWTNADGRQQSAHSLLLWRAMEQLHADGVSSLDLGLLDTVRAPGLARFKLGTGAKPCQLGATALSF